MNARSWLGLLCIVLMATGCGGQGPAEVSTEKIIITNGTVIDGLGSDPLRDGVVVIADGRIEFVGRATEYPEHPEARVIDAQGGTILPGVIDTHVHSTADPGLRGAFLRNGVTGLCDLGSPLEQMDLFNEKETGGDPVARGLRAGPIITALGGLPDAVLHSDLNYEVGNPEQARAAVADLDRRGADVIKVYLEGGNIGSAYPMIGEEELAAIVDEAHARGLLVRAHVTYIPWLSMATEAGVDVIEHVPINDAPADSDAGLQMLVDSHDRVELFFTEFYPDYETQLQIMVQAGTILVPTLDRPFGDLFRMPDPPREAEAVIEVILGIVGRYNELGGEVGLGTDYNIGIGMDTGIPLGEIEMLLAAGLTPMEVIEASTRISAEACGRGEDLGTLEPGKLADLIIVAGDPLEDPWSLSNVVLVIKDGELAAGD